MRRLRIAAVGAMGVHKGLYLFRKTVRAVALQGLPVELFLIGGTPLPPGEEPFEVTGLYRDGELPGLIAQHRPDYIWFPVRWPETFSYTLSEALAAGTPVIVPRIGALPERAVDTPGVVVYPWQNGARHMAALFAELAAKGPPERFAPIVEPQTTFYRSGPYGSNRPATRRKPLLATYETAHATRQFDACAYIRMRLPLRHPEIARDYAVETLSASVAFDRSIDAVVVQRTAIANPRLAEHVVVETRRRGIPLVFETDDDLFGISEDHPEYREYLAVTEPARMIAAAADLVTTSTPLLADRLRAVNERVAVIPNAIDERLWFAPDGEGVEDAGVLRILAMGTASHENDLRLLQRPLERLRARYGRSVELEVVGMTAQDEEDWFTVLPIPLGIRESYPLFVRWLRAHAGRWAFAAAPLIDTPFNASKSTLKYLDYGALGLAGIYSVVPPYDELRDAGAPALFAENDDDAWTAALERLVENAAERLELSIAARSHVRHEHTLGAQAEARREFWNAVLGREIDAALAAASRIAPRPVVFAPTAG